MLHSITIIALLGLFIYSGVKDYINLTLPTRLFGIVYILVFLDLLFSMPLPSILLRFLSGFIVFLLLYANAYYFNGGGGDALLLPLLALEHGLLTSLVIILTGCIINIGLLLLKKILNNEDFNGEEPIPLIPGIAIAYMIHLFGC